MHAAHGHAFGLNFPNQSPQNTVVSQCFGADFGKKGRRPHVRKQIKKTRTLDSANHNHFFDLFVMKLFETGSGLPDAYPQMRHAAVNQSLVGIAFNRQNKKRPVELLTMLNQHFRNSSAPGNNSQFLKSEVIV